MPVASNDERDARVWEACNSVAAQLRAIAYRDDDRRRTLDAIRDDLLADAQIPIRGIRPPAAD
jgi:hypothetical protein